LHKWAKWNDFPELEDHILIHSIPVHFSPAYNDLAKEAVENPRRVRLFNPEVNIISPEYLIAIMLQRKRANNRARALQFYEEAQIDNEMLNRILTTYSLSGIIESLSKNTVPESAEVKDGYIKTFFEKKKAWHKDRQRDSFEEKLNTLTKLQALALEIKKAGNRKIKQWQNVWEIK
jgi:hypothetical protein